MPRAPRPPTRRDALRLAGFGLIGAAALPGCDRLVVRGRAGPTDSITPITPTGRFYLQHCCGSQDVDPDTWRLDVRVNGVSVASLGLADLEAGPSETLEHTLQCIGGRPDKQLIDNALWEGARFADLLAARGVTIPESVAWIVFEGADGYVTSLPLADLDRPMWLVWRMNDAPLTRSHGRPARFLVPGRYGTKNVKWPVSVDLSDTWVEGFWEGRGWSDDARILPNTYVTTPIEGEPLDGDEVVVLGTAYAGDDPVVRVEVSTDGGATWADAELPYAPGANVWALWRFRWRPPGPGRYTLQARCHTASGDGSVDDPDGTNRLDGYDGSMAVEVEVA